MILFILTGANIAVLKIQKEKQLTTTVQSGAGRSPLTVKLFLLQADHLSGKER